LGINSVATAILGFHFNYNIESFCCESGPPFLFYTTMVISPFVFRA
jgi:hypothetical protein